MVASDVDTIGLLTLKIPGAYERRRGNDEGTPFAAIEMGTKTTLANSSSEYEIDFAARCLLTTIGMAK